MKNNKARNGFTLIEILLVIGIIIIMSMIKIQNINEEIEDAQAKMLAGQIQTVSEATNAFLVLKYNELSNLSSPGVSCNTGANTCNITLQNLNDNALLPPNFSSNTIFGNPYEIQLKRTGTAPNYMISGLVLTKGNKNTENTPSLVFLGKVLHNIGRDGGLNKNTGKIIGTSNGWSADSSLFPVLSGKTGYIGSAVGTLSGAYYVYLRRDGSLPMTGDLNMDGHNIINVNNLNATGALTTTGNISGKDINVSGSLTVSGNTTLNGLLQVNNNITASGNITSLDNITSQKVVSGQYLQPTSIAKAGSACPYVGYISKDSSGTILSCKNGFWRSVSDFPAGSPIPWPSNTLPQGWLICNGQSFNKALYPELAKAYPSGTLPDLRGVFIRGNDNGRGLDSGRGLGSYQDDALQKITGSFPVANRYRGYFNGSFRTIGNWNTNYKNGNSDDWGKQVQFDSSYTTRSANETRPKNVSFNYIVKAE